MTKLSQNIQKARTASRKRLQSAKTQTAKKTAAAKGKASDIVGQGKARAKSGALATKEAARKAAQKSGDTVESSPLVAVAGGLALGALVAALLPKSKAEEKYVGDVGKKINGTAKKAFEAAKDAGQNQVDNLGLNKESLRDQAKGIFDKAAQTAQSAAEAAADSIKTK